MILKTTGNDVALQAITGNYVGIPYSRLDCQAFVEQVLKDLGVRKPDGTPYNWRGSNSMFRNYINWRGTKQECIDQFGRIPPGAFVFLVKHDGGEKKHGYDDDLGNADHVGLYVGTTPNNCMDSQMSRGVDYTSDRIFTHVGLMSMIDYSTEPLPADDTEAINAIHTIRDKASTDRECLDALRILSEYL